MMEDLDAFIRSKMELIENEMKTKYQDLMAYHKAEQMALSPEDYTSDYGKVDVDVPEEHGGPPPIPDGCWAIEFQHYKWSISSSNCSLPQHDYICVDNCGNEYVMRINQDCVRHPPLNTGWVYNLYRKTILPNSLIDLFKTDSWFTAKVVIDGDVPGMTTYERGHKKYTGRSVNVAYVRVCDAKQIRTSMTPLNINSLFLTALCKIAEDYNKRFIRYADLYKDGRLREYSGVVQERDDFKERVLVMEKSLDEYREREEQYQQEITDFKKTIAENENVVKGIQEIIKEQERDIKQMQCKYHNNTINLKKENDKTTDQIYKLQRNITFYRKENTRLVTEIDTMVPREEFRELQKELLLEQKKFKDLEYLMELYENSPKDTDNRVRFEDEGDIDNIIVAINEGSKSS